MKSISELSQGRKTLAGLKLPAIQDLMSAWGEPGFRAKQLYQWIYQKKVGDFASMANLPLGLRERLATEWTVGWREPASVSESSDGTKKYLFTAAPQRFIETAYIPDGDRATLCVSTQVGCKMGCLFCATARMGFMGNLDASTIVNQLVSIPESSQVTNIVYMGMGEPLDNPAGTFDSLDLFVDKDGLAFPARKITVSTIGIPDGLVRLVEGYQVHVAISIHSPFEAERRSLMPIQQVHPMAEILALLRNYHFDDHRRLSFEYIMWDGVNDSPRHAQELVRILNGLHCRVNLIHYHSVPGNDLQGASREKMEAFQTILKDKGLVATIRRSRGEDIQAACGLLSTKAISKRPPRPHDDDY